ncbi:MAG: PHP domain-containing protein [Bacteroidales bacterium]|nr:PHP domain-containing protein [Bacteroidales bacterium]
MKLQAIFILLSPCASLEMSPALIVQEAADKKLDIIAITDHNHTAHNTLIRTMAGEKGIHVLFGVELNSAEEIHCLAYFDSEDQMNQMQSFIDKKITKIKNKPELTGYQPVIDRNENIISEIEHSLYASLEAGMEELCDMVHNLGGIFVPAHIDRPYNSLYSQLGLFPENFFPDAVEISFKTDCKEIRDEHPELGHLPIIKNSDAHYPGNIGRGSSLFRMEGLLMDEIKMAFGGRKGREVVAL